MYFIYFFNRFFNKLYLKNISFYKYYKKIYKECVFFFHFITQLNVKEITIAEVNKINFTNNK